MQKKNNLQTVEQVLELLKKWAPNKTPIDELTPFEYGVLAGMQQQINRLEAYIAKYEYSQEDK